MNPDHELAALIPGFLDELADRLHALEHDVGALSHTDDLQSTISSAYRTLHTIKGSAACLALHNLARAAHDAEQIISPARFSHAALDDETLARLRDAVDQLKALRESLVQGAAPSRSRDLIARHIPLIDVLRHHRRLALARAHDANATVDLRLDAPPDILLDRQTARALGPALLHTLSNCIDHAAQPARARRADDKPDSLTITIHARRDDRATLAITIADDGPGLDLAAIRDRAASLALLPPDTPLDDPRLPELILHPGLSTAPAPSLNAGRGIGLDAARRAITDCGGSIRVLAAPGLGTTLTFLIPALNPPSPSVDTGSESADAA